MVKRIIIIGGIVIIIAALIWLLIVLGKKSNPGTLPKVKLTYWRVFDEADDFNETFAAYQKIHPNVTIEYKKFRFEEYESSLLSAWAKGEGPDIFSIPNTWVGKFKEYIQPLPPKLKIKKLVTKKRLGIKSETVIVDQETPTLTPNQLNQRFVDVVSHDVAITDKDGTKIYGLPLALDTLALFYNKTLLSQAGISLPPATWDEFVKQVPKLTRQDEKGNILQAGAALGTIDNVPRASDILSLLMMQNGATMSETDSAGAWQATFNKTLEASFVPAAQALEFYTDFSNITKPVYTWNENLASADELFANGSLAFFFGYSYQLPTFQKTSGRLDFEVTEAPQINLENKKNFANYWIETVFNRSKESDYAWDFLLFETQQANVIPYLNKTSKPTALRALIDPQAEQMTDIAPFIAQTLTADSWYHGKNFPAAETMFTDMVAQAATGTSKFNEIISLAVSKINQLELVP